MASRHRKYGVTDGLSRGQIDEALTEWARLGREEFLSRYGGSAADRYHVVSELGLVEALALVIGARAMAGLEATGPWRGDRQNVAAPLAELRFQIATAPRVGSD